MTEPKSIRSSCLCGSVVWQAAPPFERMNHCHCSMCRKSHGAPFATYVAAPAATFRLRGEEHVAAFASTSASGRRFCRHCGSVVPGGPDGDKVWLPAGPLEADPGTRPVAHIFVASKAPWYVIPERDGAARFAAYPPGYGAEATMREPEAASDPAWVRGTCLCGDVAYELQRGDWTLFQCHCSRCRRARSAAHGGNMFAQPERFRWVRGESQVQAYRVPDAERFAHAFCTRCGSGMPRASEFGFVVPAGSLDADPGIHQRHHIFVGSKAPWFEILDDVPQHAGRPG